MVLWQGLEENPGTLALQGAGQGRAGPNSEWSKTLPIAPLPARVRPKKPMRWPRFFLQNPHHIHFYFIFLSNRQFIQYHWSLHMHELLKTQPLINYKISNFTTIGCCELSKGSVRLFHFGWTTELFYIMGHFTFISNIRALCPPYQQRA